MTNTSKQAIDYLINTLLSTDQLKNINYQTEDLICSTFEQSTTTSTATTTEPNQNEELNRWFNRINALLISKENSLNSLGARLARLTLQKDPNCLPKQGARWLQASQNIIPRHQPVDHLCLSHIIDLILNIFEWANRWPEFARENCDPKAITTLARSLIGISEDRIQDPNIRALGLRTLATLITRYASIIRPLATQLHSLALTNLLNPDATIGEASTSLVTQLYRLSGKIDASASWSKTIKATIGTIDLVLQALLSPFLNQSYSNYNQTGEDPLPPLEIPPQDLIYSPDPLSTTDEASIHLPSYRIPLLLRRSDRLLNVILCMLSQPTERPVSVPVGEIVSLASRLLLIGKAQTHDRADSAWKLGWEALGGAVTLRVMGCRLVAKLSECVTSRLTPFTSQVLTILASEIEANHDRVIGLKMADVSVRYGTYARIISRCPCNPEVVKRTLEPILKVVLQDIQAIYGSLPPSSQSIESSKQPKKSRKKSARFGCDPSWNSSLVIDPLALRVAERALDTLEILFGAVPHGFPSPYLTLCVRTILNLVTHPAFITPAVHQSSGNGKGGILWSSATSSRSPGLGFMSRPSLRTKVLRSLVGCIGVQRMSRQVLMGLSVSQTLSGVLHALLTVPDTSLVSLARQGLASLSLLTRPLFPPVFPIAAHDHLLQDFEPVDDESETDSHLETHPQQSLPLPPPPLSPPRIAPTQPPPPLQLWASNIASLGNSTTDGNQDDQSHLTGKKRKSAEDLDLGSPRPLKKSIDFVPIQASIESDSSDDDDDNNTNDNGSGDENRKIRNKLPTLVFDDDDDHLDNIGNENQGEEEDDDDTEEGE